MLPASLYRRRNWDGAVTEQYLYVAITTQKIQASVDCVLSSTQTVLSTSRCSLPSSLAVPGGRLSLFDR